LQFARRHAAGELPPEFEHKARLLAARRIRSLDAPIGDGSPLVECLEDHDATSAERDVLLGQRRRLLRQAIGELRPRHASVMRARVLEGLTQSETGKLIGVSESRVHQMQRRATTIVSGKIHAALENSSANLEMQPNVSAPAPEAQAAFTSPSTA
jgi:RNA polymerase sigma factor (sigma-70 family)